MCAGIGAHRCRCAALYDAQRSTAVTQPNGHEQVNVRTAIDAHSLLQGIRETSELLVTPLREQLDAERTRADRERERAQQAERRFAELLAEQRARPTPARRWWTWGRRA